MFALCIEILDSCGNTTQANTGIAAPPLPWKSRTFFGTVRDFSLHGELSLCTKHVCMFRAERLALWDIDTTINRVDLFISDDPFTPLKAIPVVVAWATENNLEITHCELFSKITIVSRIWYHPPWSLPPHDSSCSALLCFMGVVLHSLKSPICLHLQQSYQRCQLQTMEDPWWLRWGWISMTLATSMRWRRLSKWMEIWRFLGISLQTFLFFLAQNVYEICSFKFARCSNIFLFFMQVWFQTCTKWCEPHWGSNLRSTNGDQWKWPWSFLETTTVVDKLSWIRNSRQSWSELAWNKWTLHIVLQRESWVSEEIDKLK